MPDFPYSVASPRRDEGDPDAVIDWGSITKTITARVAEELDALDVAVCDVIEGAPDGMTVRSLVAHTSGLPRLPPGGWEGDDPYAGYTVDDCIADLRGVTLGPSDREYSNWGYFVLGIALARIGGAPIEELAVRRVLGPLGVDASYDAPTVQPSTWTMAPGMSGPGGARGTLRALVRWVEASRDHGTAIGWNVQHPQVTWHNGGTYFSSSFGGWVNDTGEVVAVLGATGEIYWADGIATSIFKEMADA